MKNDFYYSADMPIIYPDDDSYFYGSGSFQEAILNCLGFEEVCQYCGRLLGLNDRYCKNCGGPRECLK